MTETIILLDLNYTLVANSEAKRSPFHLQIGLERYRMRLIEFVRGRKVILITARPEKYKLQTLASILSQTGWLPMESYFNDRNLAPAVFKKRTFMDVIQPKHPDATFVAIESNPKTIAEYKKLGILCLSVQ